MPEKDSKYYQKDAIILADKFDQHFLTQAEIADFVKNYFENNYNVNIQMNKCIELACDIFNFLEY